jgi:hypothetical protein
MNKSPDAPAVQPSLLCPEELLGNEPLLAVELLLVAELLVDPSFDDLLHPARIKSGTTTKADH